LKSGRIKFSEIKADGTKSPELALLIMAEINAAKKII